MHVDIKCDLIGLSTLSNEYKVDIYKNLIAECWRNCVNICVAMELYSLSWFFPFNFHQKKNPVHHQHRFIGLSVHLVSLLQFATKRGNSFQTPDNLAANCHIICFHTASLIHLLPSSPSPSPSPSLSLCNSLSLVFMPSMILHTNSRGLYFIICYRRTRALTSSSNFARTAFRHHSKFSSTTSSKTKMLKIVADHTQVWRGNECDSLSPRKWKRSLFTSKT